MQETIREVLTSILENSKDVLRTYTAVGNLAEELFGQYGEDVYNHLGYWALIGGTPDVVALPNVEFSNADLPNGELTDFINNAGKYLY